VLDDGLSCAWACEVEASGVVVDAERSLIAPAILTEACAWGADVIVLTQPPRRGLSLRFCDKVSRQVMRGASCPVLVVFQGQT
jgi:nucleotide-binding universal stress UspA family protein